MTFHRQLSKLGQQIRHYRRGVWRHYCVVLSVRLKLNGQKTAHRCTRWRNDLKSFKVERWKSTVSLSYLLFIHYCNAFRIQPFNCNAQAQHTRIKYVKGHVNHCDLSHNEYLTCWETFSSSPSSAISQKKKKNFIWK